MRGSRPEVSPRSRGEYRGGSTSPTSGASEPSIGAHRGGSSTSSGHRLVESPNAPRPDEEGAPLLTMDAAIRELCERVRLRLDKLKGEHPRAPPKPSPRGLSPCETHALTPAAPPIDRAGRTWNGRDAELDAELSSVEYDINGAEFLLREIRAKLATSSTRNLPPVAAYRASLESSRRALAAIRGAGANVAAGEPRAHGGARGVRAERSMGRSTRSMGGSTRGPSETRLLSAGGAGPLGRLWKGTVSFVKDLLEDPFLDPLLPPALLAAEAEKRRRGEVPESEAMRDYRAAGERSVDYHVAAGYYGSRGPRAGAPREEGGGREETGFDKQRRRRRRRNGKRTGNHIEGRDVSPVPEEGSGSPPDEDGAPVRVTPPPTNAADESRGEYAESAWDEDEQLVRQTRENARDEQAWIRALQGAGGGNKVGASYAAASAAAAAPTVWGPTGRDVDDLVDRYSNMAARDDPMMLSDASPGSTPRYSEAPPVFGRVEEASNRQEEVDTEASIRRELFMNSSGADSRARARVAALGPTDGYPRSPFSGDAPPEGWVEEELMRGVERLERGREMLTDAQRVATDANETGDAILGTLREQRDALIRSRAGMEGVKEDMKHNERLVNNMTSWTRLGVKSRRTPWG